MTSKVTSKLTSSKTLFSLLLAGLKGKRGRGGFSVVKAKEGGRGKAKEKAKNAKWEAEPGQV